ncbi:peptidylprolyl isomerase [Olleya sp. YS]|uniref:peptidylprolyl isomerase n=1 Tax=Olleya sp. YS TaxID=3028318 RepID=UPI0024345EE0|nr:peptidylprolyl isomerase [Olleya sp. YS]WGD35089.1 peptidylprolyl isomerase [Olleya sp. YS]
MKLIIIALMVSLSSTSCQDKYPDLEDGLYAEIVTNYGTMVAKLYYDKVPVTVANFVGLAEGTHPKLADTLKGKPFYNGVIFHRVMDKFMIQGGDPTGTGMGSAGFKFYSEFDPSLSHNKAGILSMANSGGVNTNGSQFFITEVPRTNLDAFLADGSLKNCNAPRTSCHPVFGELVLGLDVQDTISNVPVAGPRGTTPVDDVVMQQVNIIRKGKDAKAFDAAKVFTEQEPLLPKKLEDLKAEMQEKMKAQAKEAADKFIKDNIDKKGEVKEFSTGLVMILDAKPNGVTPKASDRVLIDCTGYLENGTFFWTTKAEDAKKANQYNEDADKQGAYKPFGMPYNESATLVPGFREAMLNMDIGDKARIFVPSYLGYGASGNGPIPPNANIIFDLELVGLEKK